MAAAQLPLYRVNIRHRLRSGSSSSYNQLYDAAGNTNNPSSKGRRSPPVTDVDSRQNLSDWGWRRLLNAARSIYGNCGALRGAMWQMVNYAVGQAFQVQYIGRNREWGNRMEEAVYESDKICDVRGPAYDFSTALKLDLLSIIRDGDCNFILTESQSGWPQFQSIPSHRIASVGTIAEDRAVDGAFAGRVISNGVFLDDAGRFIGARIATGQAEFVDVPAGNICQDYRPEFYDQARGVTFLAPAIYDAQDLFDIRGYLKTALKAEASITLVEHNELGSPMESPSSAILGGSATRNEDNTLATTPTVEYFDDATVRYFRSNTGSKLEAPNSQRPSVQSQQFSFEILRGAFEALGWPIEFYDPSALGGANIRLRVAQAKRTLEGLQHIARRIARRKHTYAIAKLIKLGVLPPDEDWWKIEHKAPRDLTVDNGRDTKADLELYRIGAMTLDELCARNGSYWEEIQDQKIREAQRLNARCAETGVDIQQVQMLTPNGNAQPQENEKDDDEESKPGR